MASQLVLICVWGRTRGISRSTHSRCILDARDSRSTLDGRRYPRAALARGASWHISLRPYESDAGDGLAIRKTFISRGQRRFVTLFTPSVPAISISASFRRAVHVFTPLSVFPEVKPWHDAVSLHLFSRPRSFFGPSRGARGVSTVPAGSFGRVDT